MTNKEIRDASPRHAINVALTDKGRVFLEPQSGNVLELNSFELATIHFSRF